MFPCKIWLRYRRERALQSLPALRVQIPQVKGLRATPGVSDSELTTLSRLPAIESAAQLKRLLAKSSEADFRRIICAGLLSEVDDSKLHDALMAHEDIARACRTAVLAARDYGDAGLLETCIARGGRQKRRKIL